MRFGEVKELATGETLAFDPARGGVEVACERGVVWLTQAGDARDHVLVAGGTWTASGRGRVVVLALSDAVLTVRVVAPSRRAG